MDWFRQLALTVCTMSVVCAAAGLLVPEGKLEKVMKLAISCVLLMSVILPLRQIESCRLRFDSQIEAAGNEESRIEDVITFQAQKVTARAAEELIRQRLSENEILIEEIKVRMDSSPDGCISIGQVTLVMDISDEAVVRRAEKVLSEQLGISDAVICGR